VLPGFPPLREPLFGSAPENRAAGWVKRKVEKGKWLVDFVVKGWRV